MENHLTVNYKLCLLCNLMNRFQINLVCECVSSWSNVVVHAVMVWNYPYHHVPAPANDRVCLS